MHCCCCVPLTKNKLLLKFTLVVVVALFESYQNTTPDERKNLQVQFHITGIFSQLFFIIFLVGGIFKKCEKCMLRVLDNNVNTST